MGIVLGVLLLVFIVGALIFAHTIDFSPSEESVTAAFNAVPYEPIEDVLDYKGQPIHFIELGDPAKPTVLFVHGSPGSWDNFYRHMTTPRLLEHARVIAITRPGYGKSGGGTYEPSLEKQAAAILHVLDHRSPDQPAVLFGHSYGGPVVARMAMDAPDRVASLVLAAASIAPDLEKTLWYQIPASVPPIRWFVPPDLNVCNLEILALKDELEAMMPLWQHITVPVTVIHGDQDTLVPVANADFAERMLVNAPITMKRFDSMDHFFIWSQENLVIDSLLELLRATDPDTSE